jgi:AcrR family transcriptional regulator
MPAPARQKPRTEARAAPRAAAKRARRANVDRSAATQKQVHEAVIRGLHQQGFSALTNARIVEMAGISSGAMMHHFPSRAALLTATVTYAYDKLSDWRVAQLNRLEPGLPRFRAIIDLAWATARTPEGLAVNEVRIGSRSDPALAASVSPIMTAVANDYGRFVGRYVREAGLIPDIEIQALSATTAMSVRSLSIDRFTYPSPTMVKNVLFGLRLMREGIIGRQLGEKLRVDPAIQNIKL